LARIPVCEDTLIPRRGEPPSNIKQYRRRREARTESYVEETLLCLVPCLRVGSLVVCVFLGLSASTEAGEREVRGRYYVVPNGKIGVRLEM
jgi:hypothetical protein